MTSGVMGFVLLAILAFPAFGQLAEESAARSAEQAGNLRQALAQYVAALQKTAEGSADARRIQEIIAKLVPRMSPAPAIPEEARRFGVRGRTWMQDAKSEADFVEAAKEFARALRIAPWWADGYVNHGLALEKAGRLGDAVQSFKMYLLASPSAPDSGKVRDQIYALEVRLERSQKENAAAAKANDSQRQLASLAGRWTGKVITHAELDPSCRGKFCIAVVSDLAAEVVVEGRSVAVMTASRDHTFVIGTVSADGSSIQWQGRVRQDMEGAFQLLPVSVASSPSRIHFLLPAYPSFGRPDLGIPRRPIVDGYFEYDLRR